MSEREEESRGNEKEKGREATGKRAGNERQQARKCCVGERDRAREGGRQ